MRNKPHIVGCAANDLGSTRDRHLTTRVERGTYLVTQTCLPHLLRSENPHILSISPPLLMEERWFAPHVAYTMAKFGMSMVVLGVAGEYRGRVGINALWPRTAIDTAAMAVLKEHL